MKRYWRVKTVDVVVLTVAMIVVGGLYWLATHHERRCTPADNCASADAPD